MAVPRPSSGSWTPHLKPDFGPFLVQHITQTSVHIFFLVFFFSMPQFYTIFASCVMEKIPPQIARLSVKTLKFCTMSTMKD
jgi:hypothetical protein